jgi:hypothetical protein
VASWAPHGLSLDRRTAPPLRSYGTTITDDSARRAGEYNDGVITFGAAVQFQPANTGGGIQANDLRVQLKGAGHYRFRQSGKDSIGETTINGVTAKV